MCAAGGGTLETVLPTQGRECGERGPSLNFKITVIGACDCLGVVSGVVWPRCAKALDRLVGQACGANYNLAAC